METKTYRFLFRETVWSRCLISRAFYPTMTFVCIIAILFNGMNWDVLHSGLMCDYKQILHCAKCVNTWQRHLAERRMCVWVCVFGHLSAGVPIVFRVSTQKQCSSGWGWWNVQFAWHYKNMSFYDLFMAEVLTVVGGWILPAHFTSVGDSCHGGLAREYMAFAKTVVELLSK